MEIGKGCGANLINLNIARYNVCEYTNARKALWRILNKLSIKIAYQK